LRIEKEYAQTYVTIICHGDVFLLNYAISLDVARDGTHINTQGVWPCKLPPDFDSLPQKIRCSQDDQEQARTGVRADLRDPGDVLSEAGLAKRELTHISSDKYPNC